MSEETTPEAKIHPRKQHDLPPELDWLELENIRWKLQLIQARHEAGITRADLIAAFGGTQVIAEVEDLLHGDPTLGTLRRYAGAVGAVQRARVFRPAPPEEAPDV